MTNQRTRPYVSNQDFGELIASKLASADDNNQKFDSIKVSQVLQTLSRYAFEWLVNIIRLAFVTGIWKRKRLNVCGSGSTLKKEAGIRS